MRALIALLILTLLLSSCQINSQDREQPLSYPKQYLVDDVVLQLAQIFPPAQSQFILQPKNEFGLLLVKALRNRGYSVIESSWTKKSVINASSLQFNYSLFTTNSSIICLCLEVGGLKFNRAYALQNNQLKPLSSWVRGGY